MSELTNDEKRQTLEMRVRDLEHQAYTTTLELEAERAADAATGQSNSGVIENLSFQLTRIKAKRDFYAETLAKSKKS